MMIDEPQLIDIPVISDPRGNLSFLQNNSQLPFNIKRSYWTYDVPGGKKRGSHAFRQAHELIIAISGSFDVDIFDGKKTVSYTLKRSNVGLLVPAMNWREIKGFSSNSLSLVLSSTFFDEADYIRDLDTFMKLKNESK